MVRVSEGGRRETQGSGKIRAGCTPIVVRVSKRSYSFTRSIFRNCITVVSRVLVFGIVLLPFSFIYVATSPPSETLSGISLCPSKPLQLAVQVHELSTSATAEAIAAFINANGLGPAVREMNGCAAWTRTRCFSSLREVADAIVRMRQVFPSARAMDTVVQGHQAGAVVCSLGDRVAGENNNQLVAKAVERRDHIRAILEAVDRRERAKDATDSKFNWDMQAYWDAGTLRLTLAGSLTTLAYLPVYDDVDYDKFLETYGQVTGV